MTATATVHIPEGEFVVGEILETGAATEMELLPVVPVEKGHLPYLWVDAEDPATFEAAVRSDDRTTELDHVGDDGERRLYRIEWEREVDEFLTAVFDHRLIVERGYTVRSSWCFEFRAPDTEAFARFHRLCGERGVGIDVRQVRSRAGESTNRDALTEKQREALGLAFESGYFSVPRGTTLTDLAERLDISRQAFSRRLRRGTHNLLAGQWGADRPGGPGTDERPTGPAPESSTEPEE